VSAAAERVLPAGATRPRILLKAMATRDQAERLRSWFAPFSDDERRRLLGRPLRPWQPEAIDRARGDIVRRMLYVDCHGWLSDNLLERGDRMSMAASIEMRVPFLDHRMVELAFSLPTRYKIRRGVSKWVVKEVARRYLPDEIVDRPKVGFRVPIDDWFRGELRDMARDRLLSTTSFVTDVMDRAPVAALLERHGSGQRNEDIRIWSLLALEVWHDAFFRAGRPPAPVTA
jgi:asparagine synthase (glutamine-hydrolysing)